MLKMDVLHGVTFVGVFGLRLQYGTRICGDAEAITAVAATVILPNHGGPCKCRNPRRSLAWLGVNEPALQRQMWLAASWWDWIARTFGITSTRVEFVKADIAWVRDMKQRREVVWPGCCLGLR